MDPNNAERIFWEASQIESDGQREEYLDKECSGNERLRKKVDLLLAARHDAEDFLESPPSDLAIGVATLDQPGTEKPGDMITGYKLLQQIGEGGMGVVYMAEQKQPVKRRVALKIIKPGMDSRQVIARFEAERQALAMMDHPNIAKVFDCGTTDAGRPYFVMELVKGVPITEYCDENHLTARERLELFIPVCQAIQHAHQKGIIHRDIKPSNILVAEYDHTAVPKIIDFGVAKALNTQLTDKTMFTQLGQIIGTIEYMSPEQAKVNQMDVDTRSDVYSLGVVLYELLTGATPFDKTRLRSAALDDLMRIIREEEPPRPSTRLSTIDTLPSVAAKRKIEPHKLSRLLHGELDWIVMNALEKDRGRRYDTASAFAEDIEHFLHDEPVDACPPSTVYRFKKFARRNKPVLITAAVVFFSLLAGLVGTTWQMRRAVDAERQANERLEQSDRRFDLAAEAVEQYLNLVTDDQRLRNEDLHALRTELLEAALPFYDKLIDEKAENTQQRAQKGDSWLRLGLLHDALGQYDAALRDYQEMQMVFEELSREDEGNQQYRRDLAGSHENQAFVLRKLGQLRAALELVRKAIAIHQQLVSDFPETSEHRNDLSRCLSSLGNYLKQTDEMREARAAHEQAVEISRRLVSEFNDEPAFRAQLGNASNLLAVTLRNSGKPLEARKHFELAKVCFERLSHDLPDMPSYQKELAVVLHSLANLWANIGESKEARSTFAECLELRKQLAARFPSISSYRGSLAATHNDLGHFLANRVGDLEAAIHEYKAAIDICSSLDQDDQTMSLLAKSYHNVGWVLRKQGNYAAAATNIEQAIALQQKLASKLNEVPAIKIALAESWNSLAWVLGELKKWDDAKSAYQQSLKYHQQLAKSAPEIPGYRTALAGAHCNLGQLESERGQLEVALEWFGKAEQTLDEVLRTVKVDREASSYLRNVHWNRAEVYERLNRFEEAAVDWQQAMDLTPRKEQTPFRCSLASSLVRAGDHVRATNIAAELTRGNDTLAYYVMTAAIIFSTASDHVIDDEILHEEYAEQAMGLLNRAAKMGMLKTMADLRQLETDPGFEPLRSRDDFQEFQERMKRLVSQD